MPARILVVDDHPVIRRVIRSLLLAHLHSFQICEEAQNGKEAVEQVERLKPDIVLLDINMPEMDGFNAAAEIRRVSPETKIVFLSIFDSPGIMEIARLWSDAFVSKFSADYELIPTLFRLTGHTDERINSTSHNNDETDRNLKAVCLQDRLP